MPEVLWAAELEFTAAATTYAAVRAGYGDLFLDELHELFDVIDRTPLLGPRWLLAGIPPGTHRVLFKTFPYAVVYVTDPRPVVVAIMYCGREPTYWIDRLDDI